MKSAAFLITASLLAAVAAPAQEPDLRTELEVARSVLSAERQAVIADNVPLTADQAKAFWPVYNAYREKMREQGDRLLHLFDAVAARKSALGEAEANAFVDGYLDLSAKRLEIRRKFIGDIRPLLPAGSVALVLAYEEKIDAMVLDSAFELLRILASAPAN
jgi:Spy/CpxP family protein refolding chaperone